MSLYCVSVDTTCTHSVCPTSVCVSPSIPPLMSHCPCVFAEPRAAEGPRRWPPPQRRRPDLHLRRHRYHSKWGVRRWGRSRRVSLEREWQKERQHLRGGAGAWAGLPRAGAAEPRHASGVPHRGSHLTLSFSCLHRQPPWPDPPRPPRPQLWSRASSPSEINQRADMGVEASERLPPGPGAELKERFILIAELEFILQESGDQLSTLL